MCGSCDTGRSRTARVTFQCFAGKKEKLKEVSAYDIPEDKFIAIEDRDKYPVLHPVKPKPLRHIRKARYQQIRH
jgi:hypothetical protein